ncbi:MAG: beta-ketoacyl synthase chain length factor [Bacteroidales bacterium]|nr:beta-ketoacyl synthase chain length factor [Bacteroidales bacterium]
MYILRTSCISPQKTHDGSYVQETVSYTGNKYNAIEPDYKGLIRPAQLRRMGKSIRMGIGAGLPLLKTIEKVDGIILASSEGGLEDCIKFLNQIENYNEGALTPTNFVQSTPNALAGSLALMGGCKAYNMTHVHRGLAFENALLDAILLFEEHKAETLLLGNVEEISEYNFNIETLAGQFKEEETSSHNLLSSQTPGTVCGEGSSMFLLSDKPDNAIAELTDVAQICFPSKEDMIKHINTFLDKNALKPDDIDTIVIGKNGDSKTDFWYDYVCDTLFDSQNKYYFKNLVGEYATSMAFGVFLASEILDGREVPEETVIRKSGVARNILIYNHYKGQQHGMVLLRK